MEVVMRKCVVVSWMVLLGCGGGSSSAPVDPASLDACLAWANGVCRLAYLCVDTAAQDAAFHARYGTGTDTCWEGLAKRCESNQAASGAFGPSCGPGKTVNQAALTLCQDDLESMTCADWTAAPAGGCESICGVTSSSPDAGTKKDTGAGSGSVATQTEFCSSYGNLVCDRGFECDPAGSADTFGNIDGCRGLVTYACTSSGSSYCPGGYSSSLASACLADVRAASCTTVLGETAPPNCTSACKP
jgi:hypothetical protein